MTIRIALERDSIGMADDERTHATQVELPSDTLLSEGLRQIVCGPFLAWASDTAWVAQGPHGPLACVTQTLGPNYQARSYTLHLLPAGADLRLVDGLTLDFRAYLPHAERLAAVLAQAVATRTIDAAQ